MENVEIAAALAEVADLLEIEGGANPFRVRAYRNAGHTVEEHPVPLRKMLEEGEDLTALPGIGKDMASHIEELVRTGTLGVREELVERIPETLVELTRLPGVGPKRTRKLWDELGVETVDELAGAAEAGEIAGLEGFGEKTQAKILEAIERYRRRQGRFRLGDADQLVRPLLEHLEGAGGLQRLEVAGSWRRRRETVGDIDLLAIADDPGPVMERFTGWAQVREVAKSGDTRGTVHLASGLQADLRILGEEDYGAALVYFTGSKEHNVALRKRALERGLSISEYGVFRLEEEGEGEESAGAADAAGTNDDAGAAGDDDRAAAEGGTGDDAREEERRETQTGRALGERVAGRTEEEVYEAVGLPWIPPELREARGEIEAAERGELPGLITLDDIRGDLQMHSTWSDGKDSIEAMLEACAERGYEYAALTDHSQALAMTGGLDEEKLLEQWEEIDGITAGREGIRLLRSLEVDILADGSLDLSDGMLERLDLVVVAIHSRFDLEPERQTERILEALRHPSVHILAHPTGRIIGQRDPIRFDLDAVLDCAAEHGVALELNSHPARLDLRDTHLMRAKERGVKIAISTDAHRTGELELMRYGVEQARRAWLEPADVVNTLPLDELLAHFGRG